MFDVLRGRLGGFRCYVLWACRYGYAMEEGLH